MASTSISRVGPAQRDKPHTVKLPMPPWRAPTLRDGLRFFVGIPLMLAFVFSLVGIRLTYGMPYLDALLYVTLHMFIAWWAVNLGATGIKFLFRSVKPPPIAICLMGVFFSLIPAAFVFQALGDFYAGIYPVFAANRADTVTPSWSLDYLIHFIRYSLPILPTFLAGVFGYRYASGVDWYGYAPPEGEALRALNTTDYAAEATAGLIEGTKLPADARLIAIKAEQHYIQIYSDRGNDLVRYRFRDLAKTLTGSSGLQTHRSWWVNLNRVESCETDGRKLKLQLDNELTVPVSISYRNSVLAALDSQTSNADQA